MVPIFHKAKSTWGFGDAIQPHDDALDFSCLGKDLVNLLLGGVKRKISHIDGGGFFHQILIFLLAPLEIPVFVFGVCTKAGHKPQQHGTAN